MKWKSGWMPTFSSERALDPDLSLGEGIYFRNAEAGNLRVFAALPQA